MEAATGESRGDEALNALARRRRQRNGMYLIWCRDCGCKINATMKLLREEYEGEPIYCQACSGTSNNGGYGGSPRESQDIRYHGGQFHKGEW